MSSKENRRSIVKYNGNYTEIVENSKQHTRKDLPNFGTRQTLALMGFLGIAVISTMRINLSLAIRAMVNTTMTMNSTLSDSCPYSEELNSVLDGKANGELNWDEQFQGIVLGAFFYGYTLTNILGGMAAERFGSRTVVGLGVIFTSIFTSLSPMTARWSPSLFIADRFFAGFSQGVTFPAMSKIIADYYPKEERSKFTTYIFLGTQFGAVGALSLSGIISDSDALGGWPTVFYAFGALGLVWGILWIWLIRDDPLTNPRITEAELNYIIEGIPQTGKRNKRLVVPWKSIFTCVEFYALAAMHFGFMWGSYTFITMLPTYLDQILHFGLKSNGIITALLYLGTWLFGSIYGTIIDHMILKEKITILNVRRLSMVLAGYGPALMLIALCFINCHSTGAIGILIMSGILSGSQSCGYLSSHADLSPRFAGTLMGLTNTFATLPGFISPTIAGAITQNNQTLWAWRQIFILAAIIITLCTTFYLWKFDAKIKDWNDISADSTTEAKLQKYGESQDSSSSEGLSLSKRSTL